MLQRAGVPIRSELPRPVIQARSGDAAPGDTPTARSKDPAQEPAPVVDPAPLAPSGYEARFERGRYATAAVVDGVGRADVKVTSDFRDPAFLAFAGEPLSIHVQPEQFASAKKVELVYAFDDGAGGRTEEKRVLLTAERDMRTGAPVFLPGKIDVPEDAVGKVRISFDVTSGDGQVRRQWNPFYDAVVVPKGGATLTLDDRWGETLTGSLQAGERFQLAYDADRMRELLGDGGGRLVACVSFGGKEPVEIPLTLDDHDGRPVSGNTLMPSLRVPYDADKVTLWFRAEKDGRTVYDSDLGKNYSFDVKLPVADRDPEWKKWALKITGCPKLKPDNFEAIGPGDSKYNCIAWSLGRRDGWVWPGTKVEDFDKLYREQGYVPLDTLDLSHQDGVEKIALFGIPQRHGGVEATHAARNDAEGRWMSKLGTEPLIRHDDPHLVSGPSYGDIVKVYARPRPPGSPGGAG